MNTVLRLTFQGLGGTAPFTIEVFTASSDGEQSLNVGSSSTGAGAGRVVFNPFSFTKKPDIHSADLWNRLCSGTPYQTVILNASTPGSTTPFLTFAMGLVAVKTIAFALSEADSTVLETVTFEYGQLGYSVTPQNPDGTFGKPVGTAWDRTKNVAMDPSKIGVGLV